MIAVLVWIPLAVSTVLIAASWMAYWTVGAGSARTLGVLTAWFLVALPSVLRELSVDDDKRAGLTGAACGHLGLTRQGPTRMTTRGFLGAILVAITVGTGSVGAETATAVRVIDELGATQLPDACSSCLRLAVKQWSFRRAAAPA